MKTHPCFGACRERQYCGETCQKFHINDRVDANFSDPQHRSQRTERETEKTVRRNRYHIFRGDDLHCVKNEAIVFEYHEVNVFPSNHVDRMMNCRISENGRTLFRELDEENAPNLTWPWWSSAFKDSSEKG